MGNGEILFWLNLKSNFTKWIDWSLLVQFVAIPYIKVIISALLLILGFMLYLRIYNITGIVGYTGIRRQIQGIKSQRSRDANILRGNKALERLTTLVESSPFRLVPDMIDYYDYNLRRANWRSLGGYKVLKGVELNALMVFIVFLSVLISIPIGLITQNAFVGVLIISVAAVICYVLVPQYLRGVVQASDKEIKKRFLDLYLILHYTLLEGGKTPLARLLESYDRSITNKTMKRFVKDCISHMDTVGEYNATKLIADDYREVEEVQKLMRLIRQFNEGGEVKEDLKGFRAELLFKRESELKATTDRLVEKAGKCDIVIYVIMAQFVLSVCLTFLPATVFGS